MHMASTVYTINKGVNTPVEFRGLQAQYIWYLGAGIIVLLLLFAALYIAGINLYLGLAMILAAGCALVGYIYRLSRRYGTHGLMKKIARRRIPRLLFSNNRKCFIP